jgi:ATP-binding cassette subfamily B multidrug efflux pump
MHPPDAASTRTREAHRRVEDEDDDEREDEDRKMKKVFVFLWPLYQRQWRWIAAVLACTTMYVTAHLAYPYFLKYIIDGVKQDLSPDRIAACAGLLLAFGGGSYLFYGLLQACRVRVNIGTERLVRLRVFDHITRLGGPFFNRFQSGDILTRLTNDISERIAWFSCSGVFRLVEATMVISAGVGLMASIHWKLTILAVLPLPAIVVTFRILGKRFRKAFERLQSAVSAQNEILEAALSGIRIVKAYGQEPVQRGRYAAATGERVKAEIIQVAMHTLFHNLGAAAGEIGLVVVLFAGARWVVAGELTLGEFVLFNVYMLMILEPLWSIGFFLPAVRRAEVSIERLEELLAWNPDVADVEGARTVPEIRGALAFENATYAHPGGAGAGVSGVTLAVPAGKRLGIIGRVGSGKSTLVNLVPRAVDPASGRVALDGEDVRSFALTSLRSRVGHVPQEPFLFSDTIRENILLGREGHSEEDLRRAARVAQLEADIASFPHGLDEMLGPRGTTLSGGQKQRLCIARALLGGPKVLVLDDVTSNLDAATEAAFWSDLKREFPDVTVIAVCARASSIREMDRMAVLECGRLVEEGTHEELWRRGGLYTELVRRQMLKEALA